MKVIQYKKLLLVLLATFLVKLPSCNIDTSVPMSPATGTIDEIVVVMSNFDWRNELGDTVRHYLSGPYEVLPQFEPVFDVRFLPPSAFSDILRTARNVILFSELKDNSTSKLAVDLLGTDNIKPGTNMIEGHDMYGKGQQILFYYGRTKQELIDYIVANNETIINKIADNEDTKLRYTAYLGGDQPELTKRLKDNLNVDLKIPEGYRHVILEKDKAWLRFDQEKFTANLIIQSLPYTDLDPNIGVAIRNVFGKTEVKGTNKGSIMSTEEKIPHVSKSIKYLGNDAIETKGLWMMTEDFLGGPFHSYVVHDKKNNRLVHIEGFVMAPQDDKRQTLRILDYLMRSVRF